MANEGFEAAVTEARILEKKLLDYSAYDGEINIEKSLDPEPAEYIELDYNGLINIYQRTQKIISTAELGILAEKGEEVKVSVQSQQVEMKLKEMTTETLKEAEEIAKEPSIEEREIITPKEEIEIETMGAPVEKEVEIPFKEEEKPAEVKAPAPEKKPIVVPPTLVESADEAAEKRYRSIEEQIASTLGEGADELTLKKKMLELTKQLFKEKTVSKREEIKLQVKVLKNMLIAARGGGKKRKEATQTQFDALLAEQQEDLAHTKGRMIDDYHKGMIKIKDQFYEKMSTTEEHEERTKIFEEFSESITALIGELPASIEKEKEYLSQKHTSEMQKLLDVLGSKEKTLRKKVEERIDYIKQEYEEEFSMVKHIVGREIESMIEVAGAEITPKPVEKGKKKAEPTEIVKEINETDEGTMLYFLHSNEPEYYKKYERKQISRAEAIFKAKELMAKEKGLSDNMIRKYFSGKED
ncbi:hypothetical protein KKB44_06335 [Candidatus Micrarchaeota archaeon]|nr:hypothetical protein [Candidatus Micrarchaeota archaeon]